MLEDNQGDALLLDELLADAGLVMHHATRLADAIGALRAQVFDFVMCDLNLPDGAGLDVVRQLQALAGDAPLIVLTSVDDDDLAARAVQAGAQDYLVKGQVTSATLRRTLRHSRERKQLFQQLFAMTHRDALTGAVNRVGLRAQLEVAIDRSRDGDPRFAVMYLDLDHFKAINDTLGHDAGDAVVPGEDAGSASSSSTLSEARNERGAASSGFARTSADATRTCSTRRSASDLFAIHPIVPETSRTLVQPSTETSTSSGTSRPKTNCGRALADGAS